MPCHCAGCCTDPLPTYTEQFRYEKEIEYVANQEDEWIRRYLVGIEKERGVAVRIKLRSDVAKVWKNRQSL